MPDYQYTISATFTAAAETEAWDEWVAWLSEPAHLEDGTTITEVPPDPQTLYERIAEMLPTAEPVWAGRPDMDSAMITFGDETIVVTRWTEEDSYDVGLYDARAYSEGYDPSCWLVIDTADNVLKYLDDITELQPEGTDWWAWVVQWSKDAFADDRIAGLKKGDSDA